MPKPNADDYLTLTVNVHVADTLVSQERASVRADLITAEGISDDLLDSLIKQNAVKLCATLGTRKNRAALRERLGQIRARRAAAKEES